MKKSHNEFHEVVGFGFQEIDKILYQITLNVSTYFSCFIFKLFDY